MYYNIHRASTTTTTITAVAIATARAKRGRAYFYIIINSVKRTMMSSSARFGSAGFWLAALAVPCTAYTKYSRYSMYVHILAPYAKESVVWFLNFTTRSGKIETLRYTRKYESILYSRDWSMAIFILMASQSGQISIFTRRWRSSL